MIVEKNTKLVSNRRRTILDKMIQEIIERDNEAEIQVKAKSIKDYILRNRDL